MSEELLEIVDNIKQPSVWIRVLFMVLFGIASYLLILPLIIILSIAQALFSLITGKPNANLRYFSATLELYVSQIIKFLTYLSEVKPFPFSDLPEVEDSSLEDESEKPEAKKQTNGSAGTASKTESVDNNKASVKKTPAKKAAKKKAAKKTTTTKPETRQDSDD
ncbi:MAG: DUF4389 domain-containing protein [Pseudohongiellaceae bacterium]